MRNLHIERKVKIEANFDAEQWELYANEGDAEEAAQKLNESLNFYVNSGYSRETVYEKMYDSMKKLSGYGACDSEPIWFLNKILGVIYKE
jgi:hypothetical protein